MSAKYEIPRLRPAQRPALTTETGAFGVVDKLRYLNYAHFYLSNLNLIQDVSFRYKFLKKSFRLDYNCAP